MSTTTATVSGMTYLPVADKLQPSASPGLVQRNVILNFTGGSATVNCSGNLAAGIGTIIDARAIAVGSSTNTFSLVNTMSTTNTIYPITSGVTFLNLNTASGCYALGTILSTA